MVSTLPFRDSSGRDVYERRPHFFTGSCWSEGFDYVSNGDRLKGRVVKARDSEGSMHTCWADYWIYDMSDTPYICLLR